MRNSKLPTKQMWIEELPTKTKEEYTNSFRLQTCIPHKMHQKKLLNRTRLKMMSTRDPDQQKHFFQINLQQITTITTKMLKDPI